MDSNNYSEYISLLQSKLSPYRLHHSLEVAKSAKYLAEKYGGDAQKAYTAGLLHDILKEADREETFALAGRYGIEMTELEKNAGKLWHAMTGAAFIKNELGITDESIITAVRFHTTGRADMSQDEKILFIADFISSDRNYNGVEEMRQKAEISLECAMLEGLSFTIADLVENGKAVHPDTLDAYNDIIMRYKEKGKI